MEAPPPPSSWPPAQSMTRNSAFFFAARVGGAAAAYLTQVLLARWIGGEQLGHYVHAFSWCMLLATCALLGFPTASLRFVGEALGQGRLGLIAGFLRRGRQIVGAASLSVAALALALTLALAPQPWGEGTRAMLVACACVPAFAWLRLHTGVAHGFSWFPLTVLPNSALRPLLFLALLWAVRTAGGTTTASNALLLHLGILVGIAAIHTFLVQRRVVRAVAGAEPEYDTRTWLRTSTPLLLVALYSGFYPELNVVLVGFFVPAEEIAIFNAAFRTSYLIAFGLAAVDAVVLPNVSRIHGAGDQSQLQRMLRKAVRLKFACATLAVLGIVLFGRHVLTFFDEDFAVGYPTLVLLTLTQLVRSAFGPVAELLGVTGHQDTSLKVCGVSLLLTVLASVLLVPSLGILGAAIGVLVVTSVSMVWMRALVVKRLAVDPSILGR